MGERICRAGGGTGVGGAAFKQRVTCHKTLRVTRVLVSQKQKIETRNLGSFWRDPSCRASGPKSCLKKALCQLHCNSNLSAAAAAALPRNNSHKQSRRKKLKVHFSFIFAKRRATPLWMTPAPTAFFGRVWLRGGGCCTRAVWGRCGGGRRRGRAGGA